MILVKVTYGCETQGVIGLLGIQFLDFPDEVSTEQRYGLIDNTLRLLFPGRPPAALNPFIVQNIEPRAVSEGLTRIVAIDVSADAGSFETAGLPADHEFGLRA